MKLKIPNFKNNAIHFMKNCGYAFFKKNGEELSFVRRLAGEDYPRFHAYAKTEDQHLIINLHLDQKKPSYKDSNAHSGEYSDELVEEEIKRVATLANKQAPPAEAKKINPF